MKESPKQYVVAVCLSGVFGVLGIHHFYLGRWLHGILDVSMTVGAFILIAAGMELIGYLVLGIDIIHTIIITILLLVGAYKDGKGFVVTYPGQIIKTVDN